MATERACELAGRVSTAIVTTTELTETSGLAANTASDGLWAHNDSGDSARVFGVGLDGSDQGVWGLTGISAVDIEDIAVSPGASGQPATIFLADIGDNAATRDAVVVHAFDEPSNWGDGGAVSNVKSFTLLYPDGPHDAEAFVVDPVSGDWLIITKATSDGIAQVFSTTAPIDAVQPVTLIPGPRLDLNGLSVIDLGGLGSAVTAADVTASGDMVAVRTYLAVALYPREPGAPIASAFDSDACVLPTALEIQGEAFAFVQGSGGTLGYATVSEGANPTLSLFATQPAG